MMRSGRDDAARAVRVARAMEVAGRWALETGAISSFGQVAEAPAAEAAVSAAPRAERLRASLRRVSQRTLRSPVHVALATLRRELFGPWLRRSRSGYSIDPAIIVVRR